MCFSLQDKFAKQSHINAVLLLWSKAESECLLIKGAICKILLVIPKENQILLCKEVVAS